MSITVLLEILAGVLLIFSALVAAAALWVPPPRSRAAVRRRASSRTPPVEDRPERPGGAAMTGSGTYPQYEARPNLATRCRR